MTAFIGNLGGVSVAPESTWNTAGTVFADLWALGSSLKPQKDLIETEHLAMSPQNFTGYAPGFADGDVETHFTFTDSIIGALLGNLAPKSVSTYNIGPYAAPDNNGLTFKINHGGAGAVIYQYTGCKITNLTLTVEPQKYSKVSCSVIGGTASKLAAASFSAPAITAIAQHSAFSTVTIGGTQLNVKMASISIDRPMTGGDRSYVGATEIMEPIQNGEMTINTALTVELSDDTNFDSVAVIDDFIAGATAGTITMGSSVNLSNCRILGDHPPLAAGVQEFPLNFVSTQCAIDVV